MRVHDHVALSTAGAVLTFPWLRGAVVTPWAASILIDIDHYLWFCLSQRRLNPVAALRLYSQAQPPLHGGTRLLHNPVLLLLLLALSLRWRTAGLLLLGMASHVSLDAYHEARMGYAKRAALYRDRYTCQGCGVRRPDVVAHLWRQPPLLPSYRTEHLISVCHECHELAHAQGIHFIRACAHAHESSPASGPRLPTHGGTPHGSRG